MSEPVRKPYPYPNRYATSNKKSSDQNLSPFASQQRRVSKAVEEIANNSQIDRKTRIIELETIAEEIYDVWEALIADCDHIETMWLVKRKDAA